MLFENTNSNALVFSSVDDGFRQAAKASKNTQNGLASEDFNISKAYIEAKLYVVVGVRCAIDDAKYCFIFSAVPSWWKSHEMAHAITTKVGHHLTARKTVANGDNGSMFVAVGDFIETVKRVISSEVRLETPENVKNFLRDIFAPVIFNVARFSFRPCEREIGFLGFFLPVAIAAA